MSRTQSIFERLSSVKFVPEVLGAKHNEFVVAVSTTELPDHARKRTIVYEGLVVDRNGWVVCDPIHFVKPAEEAPIVNRLHGPTWFRARGRDDDT